MLSQEAVQLGTNRSVIRELFEFGKVRAAQVGAENVFDFSIGNPSVPSPQCVADAAKELLEGDPIALHGYTSAQGDATVRTVIAEHLNGRYNTSYRPEHLYMTVGAAAALCCCFHGLTCPGDEFICFAPYFPEYGVFIRGAGAKMVVIPAEIEAFQIDFDAFEAAINEHTKGVVVNSPNNPCGAVYSAETVQRLADILRAKSAQYGHPIYLISDEPYREIVYGVTVPWLPSFYDNTLVCYSYSKSLSLPGERIGYVLVPPAVEDHDTVYAAVAGAGRKLGYVCAPSLFQYVIARCDGQTADLSVYKRNKELLVKSLREMGYHCVEPGGTFYLFPRTLEPDDAAFSERAKKFDLLLVPGSGFGCPGHVRLSFCVPTERIERSLPAFEKLMKEYR
ncbi:MAG: pyridoxal phosphate-dependent aminotransferase [Oscillospiraceae bacterium]